MKNNEFLCAAIKTLNELDMSSVRERYIFSEDVSLAFALETEIEYRRFLRLVLLYRGQTLVPSNRVDTFWHYHILDTKKYINDTCSVFGELLHHRPETKVLEETRKHYAETCRLYETEFGSLSINWDDSGACQSCSSCDSGIATLDSLAIHPTLRNSTSTTYKVV